MFKILKKNKGKKVSIDIENKGGKKMTKLEELKQVLENGMVGEFKDGELGIYIQGTFITTRGGFPIECFDKLGNCYYKKLVKVHRLKKQLYHAGIKFWLTKNFLKFIEETVWENKKEVLCFRTFLEKNGLNWEIFLENCAVENQRWTQSKFYYECIDNLKTKEPENWLDEAFHWDYALQKNTNFYAALSINWENKIEKARANNIKIVWE